MVRQNYEILLVDDSEDCQAIVKQALALPNVRVTTVDTLQKAMGFLAAHPVNLVLLDLSLPDGNGMTLLDTLPDSTSVFIFSGNEQLETKVKAFGLGVDDYLTKPVNPRELRARVEMRLKKANRPDQGQVLQAGPVSVDLASMRAFREIEGKQQEVDLTGKEMKILCTLMRNRGKALSRQQIVQEVWGNKVHVLNRTVDSHIAGLRRKLAEAAFLVESIPHQGYRLRPEN